MATSSLFIRGLPPKCPLAEVEAIFSSCPGFIAARIREDRTKSFVAFCDFENPEAASRAMDARLGARIHDRPLSIDFAKGAQKRPREGEAPGPEPLSSQCWEESKGQGGQPPHVRPAVLEVAGVPVDASIREVSHVFRPFPGFICVYLRGTDVHLAEFRSVAQADVAVQALENYLFDKHAPGSSRLNLRFA
jgi:hypothetical protein